MDTYCAYARRNMWDMASLFGPNWPSSGEIDIIEGVNSQKTNSMALHTSPNCVMNSVPQLGITQTSNCDGTTNYNAGCGTLSKSTKSYGKGFNAAGGGFHS
ncbi:putative glycosidase C21B10.07 [Glarea lozoyensis 74030]|uniref:Putative glycosidase C21B10.07 n=1 Tax=Glarea lozoyensis (strain ATCC 74030 / MF5533) TaxID=1104152 RepID=H0EEP8_GLAL7|nr:putative glycosidase C21B10.07 [Glarea lozoyensis 74030]